MPAVYRATGIRKRQSVCFIGNTLKTSSINLKIVLDRLPNWLLSGAENTPSKHYRKGIRPLPIRPTVLSILACIGAVSYLPRLVTRHVSTALKLHYDLGITQKSAWPMAHRIREWEDAQDACEDVVKVDEIAVVKREISTRIRSYAPDAGLRRYDCPHTRSISKRGHAR